MEWTDADRDLLLQYKNNVVCDDIKVKEGIKKLLIQNKYILHTLHNDELEAANADPDEYFGTCILPYYMIKPTQTNVKNFICYEVSSHEVSTSNKVLKVLEVIFYVMCHSQDLTVEETGDARHDLLAALIQDQFNWSNYFGKKIQLVSDECGVVDTTYASRVLVFEQLADSNLVRTRNEKPYLANKEVRTLA